MLLYERIAVRRAAISCLRFDYPIRVLCQVLCVSVAIYYKAKKDLPWRRQPDERLTLAVRAAHVRTRGIYGVGRLQAGLRDDGFPVSLENSGVCADRRDFTADRAENGSARRIPATLCRFQKTPWIAALSLTAKTENESAILHTFPRLKADCTLRESRFYT